MYRGRTVGVVVPAYDEAGFVGEVLETVPDYVDRVYAVDDRSTDRTWTAITDAATRLNREDATDRGQGTVAATDAAFDRRIVPIRHDRNRGVGAAIATGYRRALADGLDVAAVMAGDGQMDPDYLPALLDPIVENQADYAKGNRLVDDSGEMPRLRLLGNAVLTVLSRIASGYWRIGDPQNGYTAISRHALERLDLDAVYDRYGYPNDLLVRCNAAGLRVADVSIPARYGDEESSIEYATYVPTVSALLVRTFVWRLANQYSPSAGWSVPFWYGLGALALAGSVCESVCGLVRRGPDDEPSIGRGTLLAIAGVAAIAIAARLERRLNAPLEVRRYD
ncbi:glycosyltransferase family 2 protein [Natronococcus occultus]|uniref:Glycosyl transferase n=1 Tax=Natronococcus occultus SP4 TaxID=694430 RepID=L0K3X1_9EURY|nr:glycosyltransferase family 2 protein [Natronococcus occultus]AGB39250.1 glycosyl transferase [Natronococcus occultus SP4]